MHRTLTTLGLSRDQIIVHLLQKGQTVHGEPERKAMAEKNPDRVIVLDQGSRSGPSIVENAEVKCLVIDHHNAGPDDRPSGAQFVSACHYPPVATSSLQTYEICSSLHSSLPENTAWLCVIGTHGDLGTSLKWDPPFPDMSLTFKQHTKKALNDAVSLLNAPRRTATFDVVTAWNALLAASSPAGILKNDRLLAARAEINAEVERCTHAPPKFSADGTIAVLRINSAAQVHPVIATRWAGFLKSKALEIVMVANSGHLEGMVNFSCRIAKCARSRDPPVNIIARLKEVVDQAGGGLRERMGEDYARGHKEASGGIVREADFEELMRVLRVGEKLEKKEGNAGVGKSPKKAMTEQNNLKNYFAKA